MDLLEAGVLSEGDTFDSTTSVSYKVVLSKGGLSTRELFDRGLMFLRNFGKCSTRLSMTNSNWLLSSFYVLMMLLISFVYNATAKIFRTILSALLV